ncbi:MAG: heavy-metal-associated domain-containing protein [Pseudomonadota bacterium]
MIRLNVPDMSCGHCAGVITKAMKAVDANATVAFDMHNHMVEIGTTKRPETVLHTLEKAGYPATLVA